MKATTGVQTSRGLNTGSVAVTITLPNPPGMANQQIPQTKHVDDARENKEITPFHNIVFEPRKIDWPRANTINVNTNHDFRTMYATMRAQTSRGFNTGDPTNDM